MGYLFGRHTERKDLVAELTRTAIEGTKTYTTLASCIRGSTLWQVIEVNDRNKQLPKRFIQCDLLRKVDGHWGSKTLHEADGPTDDSCPIKYLDMVPEVVSQEWRDRVIRNHNLKKIKPEPGLVLGLKYCAYDAVKVVEVLTRSTFLGETQCGKTFRVPVRFMSGQVYETWPKEAVWVKSN